MTEMRIFESDDEGSELRQRKPHRHLPLEHSVPSRVRSFASSFAGHDQCDLGAVGLRALEEAQQRGMGLRLRHAVQIEPRVDGFAAARDALFQPPPEWR